MTEKTRLKSQGIYKCRGVKAVDVSLELSKLGFSKP
jgi:hypothetical protein